MTPRPLLRREAARLPEGGSPLLRTLATLDFPKRYYALCRRHATSGDSDFRATKSVVTELLDERGESSSFTSADRSFTSTEALDGGSLALTFVIQSSTTVELLLAHSRPASREGSNFAVMAHEIRQLQGRRPPRPPYPRPAASGRDSLAEILDFGFDVLKRTAEALRQR